MVFDGYAEDLEEMHTDGSVLDTSLGLQYDGDGAREERNKRVTLASGHKDALEFDLQDLTHSFKGGKEVCGGVPGLWGFTLSLAALSPGRRCDCHGGGFIDGAGLKGGDGPLGEKAVDFEEVAVDLEGVGLEGFDLGVQDIGFGGEAGGDEVENLAKDGGREGGEISARGGEGGGARLTQFLVRGKSRSVKLTLTNTAANPDSPPSQ